MSTPDQKSQLVLLRLLESTRAGLVSWLKDEAESFRHELQDSAFVVIDSRDDDGAPPYDLLIFNSAGDHVSGVYWSPGGSGQKTAVDAQLRELYSLARGEALGVTQVLDKILSEIPEPPRDDDIPF